MSALFGVVVWSREADPEPDCDVLGAALSHRSGEVARLRVGRASLGLQARAPGGSLALAEGLAVAVDGRLDDRAGVARSLGDPPGGDAAIVAAAVRRCDVEAGRRLAGDLAAASWDEPSGRLLLIRDHLGCRPLYYSVGADRVAFATEAAALLALDWVDDRLDEERLARFVALDFAVGSRTLHRGVRRVPPATTTELGAQGTREARWWQPGPRDQLRLADDGAYEEAYRSTLEVAVRDRMVSGDHVGAHLSGGLDSTAVAVVAARQAAAPLVTVSYDMPPWGDPRDGEAQYVEAVRAQEGDRLRMLHTWGEQGWEGPAPVLRDRPIDLPCGIQEVDDRRLFRAAGVTTVLSGWGGDEAATAHGEGWHAEQLLHGRWGLLVSDARARGSVREPARRAVRSLQAELAHRGLHRLDPARHFRVARAARLRSWVARDWAERWGLSPLLDGIEISAGASVRRHMAGGLGAGHLDDRFETWDRLGAPFGIEYRYPLLDLRLVELALSLPPDQVVSRGRGRSLHRRSMAGILPEVVRHRPDKQQTVGAWGQRLARTAAEELAALAAVAEVDAVRSRLDTDGLARSLRALPSPTDITRLAPRDIERQVAAEGLGIHRFLALARFLGAQERGSWTDAAVVS
jgi:asparagine synthase (glutamine-hydrolysing)